MPELKLGKLSPDPSRPRLHFADYVKAYPPYPPSTDVGIGLHYPIWLNDTLGDCVAATRAALDLVDSARLLNKPYTETDAQVLAFYRTQNPGSQDNGMNIQLGLEYLLKHPLPSGAQIITADIDNDKVNDYALVNIRIAPDSDRSFRGDKIINLLKVKCPSTGAFYTLRVPPGIKDVNAARQWTFGVDLDAESKLGEEVLEFIKET